MWAASEGNAGAVELLLGAGADVKVKSKAGLTPFLFAVRNGHIDTVKVLLNHGANVNDTAPDGTSALNMATVNAYFELAAHFHPDKYFNKNLGTFKSKMEMLFTRVTEAHVVLKLHGAGSSYRPK